LIMDSPIFPTPMMPIVFIPDLLVSYNK